MSDLSRGSVEVRMRSFKVERVSPTSRAQVSTIVYLSPLPVGDPTCARGKLQLRRIEIGHWSLDTSFWTRKRSFLQIDSDEMTFSSA